MQVVNGSIGPEPLMFYQAVLDADPDNPLAGMPEWLADEIAFDVGKTVATSAEGPWAVVSATDARSVILWLTVNTTILYASADAIRAAEGVPFDADVFDAAFAAEAEDQRDH